MAGYAKIAAEASGEFRLNKENFGAVNDAVALHDIAYNVKDKAFAGGAKVDALTDDTAAIQAAIDQATVAPQRPVWIPGPCKVGALTLKPMVSLLGPVGQAINSTDGAVLIGTAGTDILTLQSGVDAHMDIRDISFYGGRNQIVFNGPQTTHVAIERCGFTSASVAGIRCLAGAIEEMLVRKCRANNSAYFYKHDHVSSGGFNYLDKSAFEDCTVGGGVNAYRIEVALSNSVTWLNPIINTTSGHGLYGTGGIRGWTFINPNTEGIGQGAKQDRTTLTGTVTAGATSATLASATGWANGDGMTITGAGANGTDFTIVSVAEGGPGVTVVGTALSWTGGTSTTVTTPSVTNADKDEFNFGDFAGGNPGHITFIGGNIAGSGTNAKLRYAGNFAQAFSVAFLNTLLTDQGAPIYDPLLSVDYIGTPTPGGETHIRRPTSINVASPLINQGAIKITTGSGPPTDAMFIDLPANGTLYLDVTNNKLYARIGGVWKGIVLT